MVNSGRSIYDVTKVTGPQSIEDYPTLCSSFSGYPAGGRGCSCRCNGHGLGTDNDNMKELSHRHPSQ
jgi:hypothetical protein